MRSENRNGVHPCTATACAASFASPEALRTHIRLSACYTSDERRTLLSLEETEELVNRFGHRLGPDIACMDCDFVARSSAAFVKHVKGGAGCRDTDDEGGDGPSAPGNDDIQELPMKRALTTPAPSEESLEPTPKRASLSPCDCGHVASSVGDLNRHQRNPLSCPTFKARADSRRRLFPGDSEDGGFSCSDCGFATTNKLVFAGHRRQGAGCRMTVQVAAPEPELPTLTMKQEAVATQLAAPTFLACETCGFRSLLPDSIRRHKRSETACAKFTAKGEQARIIAEHVQDKGDGRRGCRSCDFTSDKNHLLFRHIRGGEGCPTLVTTPAAQTPNTNMESSPSATSPKATSCETCGFTGESSDSLSRHAQNPDACAAYTVKTERSRLLQAFSEAREDGTFACKECEYTTPRATHIIRHVKNGVGCPNVATAQDAPEEPANATIVRDKPSPANTTVAKDIPSTCETCGFSTLYLRKHQRNPDACAIYKAKSERAQLIAQFSEPKEDGSMGCKECDYFTTKPTTLIRHVQNGAGCPSVTKAQDEHKDRPNTTMASNSPSTCETCGFSAANIRRHQSNPNACAIYKTKLERAQLIAQYSVPKDDGVGCKDCDYVSARTELLLRHVQNGAGCKNMEMSADKPAPPECPDCSYSTRSSDNLARHQKTPGACARFRARQERARLIAALSVPQEGERLGCKDCDYSAQASRPELFLRHVRNGDGCKRKAEAEEAVCESEAEEGDESDGSEQTQNEADDGQASEESTTAMDTDEESGQARLHQCPDCPYTSSGSHSLKRHMAKTPRSCELARRRLAPKASGGADSGEDADPLNEASVASEAESSPNASPERGSESRESPLEETVIHSEELEESVELHDVDDAQVPALPEETREDVAGQGGQTGDEDAGGEEAHESADTTGEALVVAEEEEPDESFEAPPEPEAAAKTPQPSPTLTCATPDCGFACAEPSALADHMSTKGCQESLIRQHCAEFVGETCAGCGVEGSPSALLRHAYAANECRSRRKVDGLAAEARACPTCEADQGTRAALQGHLRAQPMCLLGLFSAEDAELHGCPSCAFELDEAPKLARHRGSRLGCRLVKEGVVAEILRADG